MRRCIGRTDTELTKIVLTPTTHRVIGENCACVRTTCCKLCHRAAHCNLHGIKLVCTTHTSLSLTAITPTPHRARTGENTSVSCACHHFRRRSNSPVPKHASAHGQQTLGEPRVIRATELALIIATPTPHRVVGFDRTREPSTGSNAIVGVYCTCP